MYLETNKERKDIIVTIAKDSKKMNNNYDKLYADGSREDDFRSAEHKSQYGVQSWEYLRDTIAYGCLTPSEYSLRMADTKDLNEQEKYQKRMVIIPKVASVMGRIARALADRANYGTTKENKPLTLEEMTKRFVIAFNKKCSNHDGDCHELINKLDEFKQLVYDFE